MDNLPSLSTYRGHLLDQTTTRLLIPHDLHRLPCHGDQAKEVHVHLRLDLRIGQLFERPAQAIACIVDHDIDMTKYVYGRCEGQLDVAGVCYVELDGVIILGGSVFEGE